MSTDAVPIEQVLVTERELWQDGPPHELFKQLRAECPVHWTDGITSTPRRPASGRSPRAEDVHAVSRDWQTYSSERGGITALDDAIFPLELSRAMFIGMDPPKHDRLKALFQRGFTPKRIAEHEDAIRAIADGVLDRLDGRETCDLVSDVAQPVVVARDRQLHGHPARGRRGLGAADERDARRRRPGPQRRRASTTVMQRDVPEIFERCRQAHRRAPRDARPTT